MYAGEMLSAIHFHNQARLVTIEVQDVGTELVLTAKLGSGNLAVSEQLPEQGFSVSVSRSQNTATF